MEIQVLREGFSAETVETVVEETVNPCGCGGMCTFD